MHLILPTSEANARNSQEATKQGWNVPNAKYWSGVLNEDGSLCALNVLDGNGLTESELADCVNELPIDFLNELI